MSFFKPIPHDLKGAIEVELHGMVDIETLGTAVDAPIITIGATVFNPRRLDTFEALKDRSFYIRIDVEDAVRYSGGASGGTLKWWFQQDVEAIRALVDPEACSLRHGLKLFDLYMTDRGENSPMKPEYRHLPRVELLWAKSPDFDCKILQTGFESQGLMYPFKFWNQRCVRTAVDMAFPDPDDRPEPETDTTAHDARDDAINQAIMIQRCYKQLGLAYDTAEFLP